MNGISDGSGSFINQQRRNEACLPAGRETFSMENSKKIIMTEEHKGTKTMRKLWAAVLLLLILVTTGSAIGDETSREVEIKVQGLACPFCAYGVEKRLKKLEAVESVDVSLKTGDVHVKLKAGKSVTEEQLRQAIQKGGFTAKEIHFGK